MTKGISFREGQVSAISAIGKITLNKPRLHMDQIAPIHYLIYVVSGTFHVSEDDEHYSVKGGQVFFRESGKHHFSHTYMSPGTVWYWIAFSLGESEGQIYTLPKLQTIDRPEEFFQRLDTMLHLYRSDSPYRMQQLSSELNALFYRILAAPAKHLNGNKMLVKKVDNLLGNMLDDKFDANKIAAKMNLDYSYIGKCYKADTGVTINHHFNSLKVQKAKSYMQEGAYNITEISDLLGYPNPFYFSRVFKKFTGISPRAFIKQLY